MNEESVGLILALQLQDLEELGSKTRGKGRETDEPSDSDLALQLQQQEIEQAQSLIADRQIAQSVHRAVQDDGANIVILASEENNAAADHELACRLAGRILETSSQIHNLVIDNSTISMLSAFNIEDDSEDDTAPSLVFSENDEAESSALAATRRNKTISEQKECISCQEVKEVAQVSCRHLHCRDCIRQLFTDAIVDETLFPPRCCRQHIPVSMVRHFLKSQLTARFEQKAIEYGTLNRTYCCDPSCATFVDSSRIHDAAGTCPESDCERQTCILCKREAHSGTCDQQDSFEDTIRLAQQSE